VHERAGEWQEDGAGEAGETVMASSAFARPAGVGCQVMTTANAAS
jgi:hypothetical protein